MKTVITKAYIADVETRDVIGPHNHLLVLDCLTPERKRFSVALTANRTAPLQSTKGRNFGIIRKMLRLLGIDVLDNEDNDFDDKATWARIRGGFFWFKMDSADDGGLFLRDVKSCEPFPTAAEEFPFEDILAMFAGAA